MTVATNDNQAYTRKRFRADLKALGMTQDTFAARYGISRRTLDNWGGSWTSASPMPEWVPDLLAAWLEVKRLRQCEAALYTPVDAEG